MSPWEPVKTPGRTTTPSAASPIVGVTPPVSPGGLTSSGMGAALTPPGMLAGASDQRPTFAQTTDTKAGVPVYAPLKWLHVAQALVVIGLVTSFLPWIIDAFPSLISTVIGWLLCGFGALGMSAVFTRKDAEAQSNTFYVFSRSTRKWYATTIAFAILGVVLCAGQLALAVGRI